jgi:hypothetical protein
MNMIGTKETAGLTVGLSYTYAERFWTVTGSQTERVAPDSEYNAVHLMASVWHTETDTVLPLDPGLQVTVERDGEQIAQRGMWPMLSQSMGAHFGDNIQFPEQGTYTFVIDIGSQVIPRRGQLDSLPEDPGTVRFPFEFERGRRNSIPISGLIDSRGEPGAAPPMEMSMQPLSLAPNTAELPGRVLGEATSGDAVFVCTATDTSDGTYLAVSARTPYNQFILPLMSLSATVERGTKTVFDGQLSTAIDSDRQYHYGVTVDSIESGDRLTLRVDLPPQVARHAGYETAFLEMPNLQITV